MFKIEDNTIYITRGDSASIEVYVDDYIFEEGDIVRFRAYKKEKLNELPVISKKVVVQERSESVIIELSSEDTRIGDMLNIASKYWFEVELNGSKTILGYDEDGAKILVLYPEGADNGEYK